MKKSNTYFTPERKLETMEKIISLVLIEFEDEVKNFKTANCTGLLMRSVLYDAVKIVNQRFKEEIKEENLSNAVQVINREQGDGKMGNDLEIKNIDKPKTIESREIAQMVEMDHADLLKKLEGTEKLVGIIPTLTKGNFTVSNYFIKSSYKDNSGKENKCYLFTKMGCEFIANKFTGEKGILFTAKYVERFNEMENNFKAPLEQLSPQLQLLINMELEQQKLKAEITEAKEETAAVKQEVQGIRDVIVLNPNSWKNEVNNILSKIAVERGGTTEAYREVRNESYKLLNERAGAKLDIRLTNRRRKVLEETGSKSKAEKVSKLDVIADDKRLTEVYIVIVKEMAIKYKIA